MHKHFNGNVERLLLVTAWQFITVIFKTPPPRRLIACGGSEALLCETAKAIINLLPKVNVTLPVHFMTASVFRQYAWPHYFDSVLPLAAA